MSPECSGTFSFTHTGKEKLSTAIAIPTVIDEIKSMGTLPTARRKIAADKTVKAQAITLFVPPILPTSGIKKALPAKQSTESEVKKES